MDYSELLNSILAGNLHYIIKNLNEVYTKFPDLYTKMNAYSKDKDLKDFYSPTYKTVLTINNLPNVYLNQELIDHRSKLFGKDLTQELHNISLKMVNIKYILYLLYNEKKLLESKFSSVCIKKIITIIKTDRNILTRQLAILVGSWNMLSILYFNEDDKQDIIFNRVENINSVRIPKIIHNTIFPLTYNLKTQDDIDVFQNELQKIKLPKENLNYE